MKVTLDEIKASPTPLRYHEAAEALHARLHESRDAGDDFRFPSGLEVRLEHYRAGLDVVFNGTIEGVAEGTCARCIESYPLPVVHDICVVLAPRSTATEGEGDDDLGLGFFDGEDIDVSALVVEHVILGLPTVPLCNENCDGLCPLCGTNRNVHPCTCVVEKSPPQGGGLASLASVKIQDQRGGR